MNADHMLDLAVTGTRRGRPRLRGKPMMFYVTVGMREAVEAHANQWDCTLSEAVRVLIQRGLDCEEQKCTATNSEQS